MKFFLTISNVKNFLLSYCLVLVYTSGVQPAARNAGLCGLHGILLNTQFLNKIMADINLVKKKMPSISLIKTGYNAVF
jgi:hypothetical protein